MYSDYVAAWTRLLVATSGTDEFNNAYDEVKHLEGEYQFTAEQFLTLRQQAEIRFEEQVK